MLYFFCLLTFMNSTADKFQDSCHFSASGRNTYFILEPGYQLILEGRENNKPSKLVITVLNETKLIGGVETRIVEEHESVNGKTIEISRNFFAFCRETESIYYFGEEVDMYKNGKITGHEGAWIAEGNNRAGIIMPGKPVPGSEYFQEMAPGIAMDKMKIISVKENFKSSAGQFTAVLKIEETTPLEPGTKEYKLFAPGIGLIRDGNLVLTHYGFK